MVRALIILVILNLSSLALAKGKSHSETIRSYPVHTQLLNDPKNKIPKEFKAHPDIMPRVHFWFNVYTKFSSKDHIIHHTLHPWIVYEVVNVDNFYKKYKSKAYAKKKAEDYVRKRKKHYRKIINKLARLKKFNKLNAAEHAVLKKVQHLGKQYKKNLWIARKNIRSQTGQNDFFHEGVLASTEYEEHMKEIFAQQGLPTELTYLTLVESSFNLKAQSKVGASGIWQIMPPTGKQYGIVNRSIDERNSPLKATLMAAKLMKFNFKQLQNWPLAITAYNNGIGNIRKSLRRARTKNPYVLINNHRRGAFGFASANFYASFIAAVYTKKYSKEIFKVKPLKTIELETVYFKNKTSLRHIIRHTGISLKQIKNLNYDLKKRIGLSTFLPKKFILFLPVGSSKKLLNRSTYLVNVDGKKSYASPEKSPRS